MIIEREHRTGDGVPAFGNESPISTILPWIHIGLSF